MWNDNKSIIKMKSFWLKLVRVADDDTYTSEFISFLKKAIHIRFKTVWEWKTPNLLSPPPSSRNFSCKYLNSLARFTYGWGKMMLSMFFQTHKKKWMNSLLFARLRPARSSFLLVESETRKKVKKNICSRDGKEEDEIPTVILIMSKCIFDWYNYSRRSILYRCISAEILYFFMNKVAIWLRKKNRLYSYFLLLMLRGLSWSLMCTRLEVCCSLCSSSLPLRSHWNEGL